MNIILPHIFFEADKLEAVKAEMVALEGAHRLRAAQALGLVPEIEEVEYSETVTTDEVVPGSYDDTWTISQIVDDAHRSVMLTFGDAE